MLKTENGKVCEMTPEEVAAIDAKDALRAAAAAKAEAIKYQYQRAAEYPSLAEQMDMQYWDAVNGTTTWQNTIAAIKAKYPKPE